MQISEIPNESAQRRENESEYISSLLNTDEPDRQESRAVPAEWVVA